MVRRFIKERGSAALRSLAWDITAEGGKNRFVHTWMAGWIWEALTPKWNIWRPL
ncbi:hypothetical protein XFLM_08025 [Xylella fastidiosa subsp. fastidiosa GB514]|nr:hypothetical protein XFLM_08025 [Xylella fastidiosa subsp. fastidiosa GB514]